MRPTTILLLATFACAGCVTVRSSTSPGANLAQYHSFAWYQSPTPTEAQLAFERSPAGQLVRDRIAADLAQKGIHPTTENPDFYVAYHTKLEQKTTVSDWGYPGLFWGAPGPARIDEYTQGTLIVDFIDAKSGQIFWRGTAGSAVNHPATPDMNKLASAVDKMMGKYPAEVASAPPRHAM